MKKFFFLLLFPLWILCQDVQILPSINHLGKIPDTKPVACFFEIYNASSKTLEILKVHSFCSCNVASMESKEILPGQKKKLEVTFNPHGRNSGYLRWEIQVFHNFSSQPTIATFDVTVLKDNYISHPNFYLGEFPQGKQREARLWISPRNFPDFAIKSIDFELNADKTKCFDIVYETQMYDGFYPEARKALCLKAIAKKEIPSGVIQGKVFIHSNFPEKPIIEIPIFAKVSGEISISRTSLNMGILGKEKNIEKTFMVYSVEEKESFEIQKIESSLSFLLIKVEPLIPGIYYQIHVNAQIPENITPGEFRGQITIYTNHPRQSSLVLPVQGFIPSLYKKNSP
ncbi:MAG: DUF1573 domain-containing protein [Candidatus Brocadiae bacterium]|nr:DUF1573 domain-containing protein [Candidatus Brocadiia bacterium]